MSTRSTIGIIDSKGKEKRIYCQNDGYLDNNGELLLKYWNTPDKINELMEFGSIYSLREYPWVIVIGFPHKNTQHTYQMFVRNKNDVNPKDVGGTYDCDEEYNYTWKNGEWWVEFRDEDNKKQNLPLKFARLGFEGHKTSVPQRKRAAPKKHTPAVRVNVRKMF